MAQWPHTSIGTKSPASAPSTVPVGVALSIGERLPVGRGPVGLVFSGGVMFHMILWFGVTYAPDGVPGGVGVPVISSCDGVVRCGTVLSPVSPAGVPCGVGRSWGPNWLFFMNLGVLVLSVVPIGGGASMDPWGVFCLLMGMKWLGFLRSSLK